MTVNLPTGDTAAIVAEVELVAASAPRFRYANTPLTTQRLTLRSGLALQGAVFDVKPGMEVMQCGAIFAATDPTNAKYHFFVVEDLGKSTEQLHKLGTAENPDVQCVGVVNGV